MWNSMDVGSLKDCGEGDSGIRATFEVRLGKEQSVIVNKLMLKLCLGGSFLESGILNGGFLRFGR